MLILLVIWTDANFQQKRISFWILFQIFVNFYWLFCMPRIIIDLSMTGEKLIHDLQRVCDGVMQAETESDNMGPWDKTWQCINVDCLTAISGKFGNIFSSTVAPQIILICPYKQKERFLFVLFFINKNTSQKPNKTQYYGTKCQRR